jgi:hypothetical protein
MSSNIQTQSTLFSFDGQGRWLCNTLSEALWSAGVATDPAFGPPPPDARPFDVVVIGGGTFGSVFAQHLLTNDKTNSRRILVLDAGPYSLPEHEQNMPFGVSPPTPGFREPWVSNLGNPHGGFTGLLFTLGGRSLKWGGWSPELLDAEIANWPLRVKTDLKTRYFAEASEQIGAADTNDFIYGEMHSAMRKQLLKGIKAGAVGGAVPLNALPDHAKIRFAAVPPSDAQIRDWFGIPAAELPNADLKPALKLEAPLAVQSRTEAGQFPFNKFNSVQVLIKAVRQAADESVPFDELKRLMAVPNTPVLDLVTQTLPDNSVRVTGVRVANNPWGDIPLAAAGVVVIALGTVESTRLALRTFQASLGGRAASRMGENLIAHLRSNLTIRVPREALEFLLAQPAALQTSALFVKGKANIGGRDRFFHIQITASGLGRFGVESEAELFKKLPDLDTLDAMRQATDTHVVITLRGIGEMSPENPDSGVELAQFDFDLGRQAAWVRIGDAKKYAEMKAQAKTPAELAAVEAQFSTQTKQDADLWEAMDNLTDDLALVFANTKSFEILAGGRAIPLPANAAANDVRQKIGHLARRDGLGTTHHEAGTLRMGDQIATSVSDIWCRIYDTTNCYVAAPALFPSLGSPNPMLTGVALARRTADFLSRKFPAAGDQPPPEILPSPAVFMGDGAGWSPLFDGTAASFKKWQVAGNASPFKLVDGQVLTTSLDGLGLLWYAPQPFSDFTLKLQFRIFDSNNHNSGVFIRFRDPRRDLPEPIASRAAADLQQFGGNRSWTAVHSGFEVQIDDWARPDGLPIHRTGAIYNIPAGSQQYQPGPALAPGVWFEYEIKVQGQTYEVWLTRTDTGERVRTTRFVNADAARGLPASADPESGFVGLQAYGSVRVAFRRVQIKV